MRNTRAMKIEIVFLQSTRPNLEAEVPCVPRSGEAIFFNATGTRDSETYWVINSLYLFDENEAFKGVMVNVKKRESA